MAEFSNRPLAVLGRLYKFLRSSSVRSDFDTTSAIQPVHDVSRESELGTRGRAQAGYLQLGQTFVHPGADARTVQSDVYALFDSIPRFSDFRSGGDDQHRLWLLDIFGSSSGGGTLVTSVDSVALLAPDDRSQFLAGWDDAAGSAGVALAPLTRVNTTLWDDRQYPAIWQPGSLWITQSVSSAANTVRVHTLWWAGPLGTTPPGMR